MTTQHVDIYHCQHCGKVLYEDCQSAVPQCCGEEMVRAVSDLVWELDQRSFQRIPPKARELLRAMQEEHRNLVRTLTEERDRWNDINDPAPTDYAGMRARLQSLRDRLAAHFAEEEQGGYLCEALAAAPRFAQRASELCCQHECFLETLDRLRRNLRAEEPESWNECRSDFGQLVVDLRKHEGSENAIVQAAFTDDVGTCD